MLPRRSAHLSHDARVFALALAGGLPAVATALVLLHLGDYAARVQWTLGGFVVCVWLATAAAVRVRVVRPLQTLANLIAALREGDYTIRARGARLDDPLGLALAEVNALREPLRAQRLGALEAVALLRRVMEEIDVAVIAVDESGVVRLVNRAGERLLGQSSRAAGGATGRAARPRRMPHGRAATCPRRVVPRQRRALGAAAQHLPPGRRADAAPRARRPASRPARGGAAGVAAARAGAEPRDQQLARADPVDRRQPARAPRPHAAPRRRRRGPAARASP
jgi:PAS domain-containing protein